MSDNIINVKKLLLDFVADNILTQFPSNYTQDSQIYWSYTQVDDRPSVPYFVLSVIDDNCLQYDTFHGYRVEELTSGKKIYKIEKQVTVLTVGFSSSSMETNTITALEAQNLAQTVSRYIRRLFTTDKAVDWFEYSNTLDIKVGVESENLSKIEYNPDYEDTKTNHKYSFTCQFNWEDVFETEVSLAKGIDIYKINNDNVNIVINLEE